MTSQFVDYTVDDESAAAIAQRLASSEKAHATELWLVISDKLTESGALVIARDGLKHSNKRQLKIWHDDRYGGLDGNALQPILEVAVHHVHIQELRLSFEMNEGVAKKLSEALLSLNANNGASDNHGLHTLRLSIGPNLTESTFQQLANGLRHVKFKRLELCATSKGSGNMISSIYREAARSVEELVLPCTLTGEDAVAFGNALMGNTTLQSVKFGLQRDLSIHGAVRLADGISQSRIVRLEMESHAFHNNTSAIREDVEDALYDGVARSPTIQHLYIGEGLCGTSGLARCLTKQHMLQTHPRVVVDDVPAVMTGLISAPHLTTLDLGQYLKNKHDMLALCAALPRLVSLTDLSIYGKLAFDDQPRQAGNDVLRHFSHRLHCVQATGAEQLMVAVANHPSLLHLTIKYSRNIGFVGLAMIGTHLPNIKLKSLHLKWIHDEYDPSFNKEKRVKQALQRACKALVAGVRSNCHLHDLTLRRCNNFPPSVIKEIDFYLDLNKSGRHLFHDRDSKTIPMGLWCRVLAKCGNKAGRIFYHLREQACTCFWRVITMCHFDLHHKTPTLNGLSVPDGERKRRHKEE